MAPRLEVDFARCRGHGICALRAAPHVVLDEWGFADVDPAPLPTARALARARRAVAACPAQALRIVAPDAVAHTGTAPSPGG